MRADYIKFARARGLAERVDQLCATPLRNTLVPVITVIGLNIGGLVALFGRDHRDGVSVAGHGA